MVPFLQKLPSCTPVVSGAVLLQMPWKLTTASVPPLQVIFVQRPMSEHWKNKQQYLSALQLGKKLRTRTRIESRISIHPFHLFSCHCITTSAFHVGNSGKRRWDGSTRLLSPWMISIWWNRSFAFNSRDRTWWKVASEPRAQTKSLVLCRSFCNKKTLYLRSGHTANGKPKKVAATPNTIKICIEKHLETIEFCSNTFSTRTTFQPSNAANLVPIERNKRSGARWVKSMDHLEKRQDPASLRGKIH